MYSPPKFKFKPKIETILEEDETGDETPHLGNTTSTRVEDDAAGLEANVTEAIGDDALAASVASSSLGETISESSTEEQQGTVQVPGKLVNFMSKAPELLKVEILLNGTPVVAVLDTGAARSLISRSVAESINLVIEENTDYFRVLGKETFKTLGSCSASLSIAGIKMEQTQFTIYPDNIGTGISLLLGIDFLKTNGIELCIGKRLVVKHYVSGGSAEIYLEDSGVARCVMLCDIPCLAARDTRIDEGRAGEIPVSCDIPVCDSKMLLYSDKNIDGRLSDKIHGLSGIYDVEKKFVLVISRESSTKVQKGQSLGTITSVLELPNDVDELPAISDIDFKSQIILDELTIEQQTCVFSMLNEYMCVFSMGDHDIGHASVTQHKIKLTDNTPIYQRPRRFPKPIAEEIERQCQELNSLDIIEPSISPWSSPVVPVRKKDGSIRMCIDYRKLNKVTVADKFPVPNLSDSIFGLQGTNFFTRLDLVRGYYQLPIDDESKPYTAFTTNRNHWQFKRLSFGLRNAPSAFQREIQAVLSSFPSNKVIAYIDDILIMSNTFHEHVSLVSKVLQTLLTYNIKIKPSKCDWFKSHVEYLGHVVSRSGIRKTRKYVQSVVDFPQPKTVSDLRQFLGFINFQRKFLPRCSEIQKPLSCLTGGKRSKVLDWTPEMLSAFNELKTEMQLDIELAYPDYDDGSNKLELWVDASSFGAGAYLAQEQQGSHRIIGFASMTFTETQLNYSTLERELTALRWGVKTFRHFLYGVEFILYTDHQPLVHLHNMRIVCSRLARTLEELSDYIFEIRYVPGHLNSAADALSRLGSPLPPDSHYEFIPILPPGLVLNGLPAFGGGDSLFVSIHRSLCHVNGDRTLPTSDLELRVQLVDELLTNADKYNMKLDRNSRKELRVMRCPGQLPSLDVLLAASKIYHVKFFVYFWSTEPVIYQFDNYSKIIHLQCISGIHFNPLIEVVNYILPDLNQCSVNSVYCAVPFESLPELRALEPDIDDASSDSDCSLLNIEECVFCGHGVSSLPQISVSFGNNRLCALLDTGAEISLVSVSALGTIALFSTLSILEESLCDIVGFSGERTSISQTVELSFAIGPYVMPKAHRFAVVADDVLPHCFLLGLDFLMTHQIDIDLKFNSCKQDSQHNCYTFS